MKESCLAFVLHHPVKRVTFRNLIFEAQSQKPITVMHAVDPTQIQSWRQYVPLVVTASVIIDIVLGSPLANSILKPLKASDDIDSDHDMNLVASSIAKDSTRNKKQRVDSEAMARIAFEKAQHTLDMVQSREKNSDEIAAVREKIDRQMAVLDDTMEELSQQEIS